MNVYETENSRYEIDLVNRRYRRSPLPTGTPSIHSERLRYGEWLPLKDVPDAVTIVHPHEYDPYKAPELRRPRLRIMHETSTYGIVTSPIVYMEVTQ